MTNAHKQWLPMVTIIFASSILFTGCKSTSWTSLPGMSYFAKKDPPAASYYGTNQRPANDYTAAAVDHSNKYNADGTAGQGYYGEQYHSTNQGNSNYLAGYPDNGQQQTGQPAYQSPVQRGPQYNTASNQLPTYDGQPQYQQPQYQQPQYQQPQYQQPQYQQPQYQQPQYQQPQYQQPLGQTSPYQQPISNQPAPGAGSLQNNNPAQYDRGFYDPNALPQAANGKTQNQDTYILRSADNTKNLPTQDGAAAYTANLSDQAPQFDGAYNPVAPAQPMAEPLPQFRPGSTGNTNSYYAPNSTSNDQ